MRTLTHDQRDEEAMDFERCDSSSVTDRPQACPRRASRGRAFGATEELYQLPDHTKYDSSVVRSAISTNPC